MDRCTRGDRCKFSHGEDDSDEKKARLEKERRRREDRERDRDRDRDRRDRRRSRSRSRHRRSRSRDRDRDRGKKGKIHIIHIDELKMPNRPDVEPAPTDVELFVDPLPDEDLMDTCLNAFGSTEDIYVLPIPGPRKGYVKFRDHGAAIRAVEAGFGSWSESERVLSSQRSKMLGLIYFDLQSLSDALRDFSSVLLGRTMGPLRRTLTASLPDWLGRGVMPSRSCRKRVGPLLGWTGHPSSNTTEISRDLEMLCIVWARCPTTSWTNRFGSTSVVKI